MPGLARVAFLLTIVGALVWPGGALAVDRAGPWSDAAPIDAAGTYVDVSGVGATSGTRLVIGEHVDRTASAFIARGGTAWSRALAPPAWSMPPLDPTGTLTPGPGGYGCGRSALAPAPDGSILVICDSGVYLAPGPLLTAAVLGPGSSTLRSFPVPHAGVPLHPHIAIGTDGTMIGSVAYLDPSGHSECGGLAWYGPFGDPSRWQPLTSVEGTSDAVAAGADGSLVVAASACASTGPVSGQPRLVVAARRGTGTRWSGTTVTQTLASDLTTFAAVAPNGRIAVVWHALDPGYRYYQPRWASIGSAIRPGGAERWTCRPVVGRAACSLGSARERARSAGAIGAVRAARVYALSALPDSSFVLLFSGIGAAPARPGGLYLTRLAPGAAAWSPARRIDPDLFVRSGPLGSGPAAVALDAAGGLLVAWPHAGAGEAPSLRVERLAAGATSFTLEADLRGTGIPFEPVLAAPPDGPASVAWIDATAGLGSEPSGRVLVADRLAGLSG